MNRPIARMQPVDSHTIATAEQLRSLFDEVGGASVKKEVSFVHAHYRALIEAQSAHSNHAGDDMTIEISKEARKEAIASIERYFQENMEERIGNIAAGALLGFFLEELGPIVYNKAVADVQDRLQARIAELDIEVHEDEFQYWRRFERQRKSK